MWGEQVAGRLRSRNGAGQMPRPVGCLKVQGHKEQKAPSQGGRRLAMLDTVSEPDLPPRTAPAQQPPGPPSASAPLPFTRPRWVPGEGCLGAGMTCCCWSLLPVPGAWGSCRHRPCPRGGDRHRARELPPSQHEAWSPDAERNHVHVPWARPGRRPSSHWLLTQDDCPTEQTCFSVTRFPPWSHGYQRH